MARPGKTSRRKLAKAYDQLLEASVSVIGAVTNCCDDLEDDYVRHEWHPQSGAHGEEGASPTVPQMAGGAHGQRNSPCEALPQLGRRIIAR